MNLKQQKLHNIHSNNRIGTTNPICSSHVLTEDTVFREVRDGKLYSKRLLSKTNRVPKWGERFYNSKSVKILEESVCDPKTKTLTTYTRNIAFTKIMSVTEKVVYRICDENNSRTAIYRMAWIDSQVFGFSRAIRAFGFERFKKNCSKMLTGFEYVLNTIYPYQTAQIQANQANLMMKTQKIKEAAKHAVKSQAEQIYQAYSVKN